MSQILKKKKNNFIFNIIIFIPLISYIFGFYFNENSAGAGVYDGDSSWIRKNIDIFFAIYSIQIFLIIIFQCIN